MAKVKTVCRRMDTGQPFDALLIQLNRMLAQPEVGPAISSRRGDAPRPFGGDGGPVGDSYDVVPVRAGGGFRTLPETGLSPGTVLRRGEAAGLRWRDVDLDGKTAVICQQLQQYDGHLAVCPPKTPHSARTIALDHTTAGAAAGAP